ncbi:tetratricopeptide repeat protein [Pedosphaera parvula]|uniref:TPR repeat-containing protein n=1 Tax=Pedosphaera parvula (strain Ellin514) TaxID=320771 RepID=B9XN18_PEDPL|nr:tetratricopeptide repeat protein [Pedosphaera parvula]EEF58814.1 TPR repeat-containing protein [Pedosphaera parvula Ellin514]
MGSIFTLIRVLAHAGSGSVFGILSALVFGVFQIWMLINAWRNKEYLWVLLILMGLGIWYFFYVYRHTISTNRGFELPGASKRKRIKELQAKIHHLDNAVHHFHLGDIYFQQGKLDKAEACYRAALERDPKDIDARAHLGQTLLRLKRPAEARPLLEGVCHEDPKHDYGYSMMALAETLSAVGEQNAALEVWLRVTSQHSYPRAKVQLAELYVAKNQLDPARAELRDILADDAHAPAFQRKRDRVWVHRAKRLIKKI